MTETPKRRGRPPKDLVEVITLRRIGLDDRTADVGEQIWIKREYARLHQDSGAIKVVI